jgi:hypothetical protein
MGSRTGQHRPDLSQLIIGILCQSCFNFQSFFFGYVNVFTSHVYVGFFYGAALPDPARLLRGTGKFMRQVKLRPGTATNAAALSRLIETAYSDMKARVENG